MSEKRRLSTRNRGEPPLKKRALSPPPPPPPRPQPAASVPPPPPTELLKDGLPVKLKEGLPLPTLLRLQNRDMSTADYQSISESGVLAASIERSRHKWLAEGVFERYWVKPHKKRDMSNTPNPAKETMTRLGTCSMIIDPHVFEVTLYTVKEQTSSYPSFSIQPPYMSAPQYNTFNQGHAYAPPTYNAPSPAPNTTYSAQQPPHPSQHSLPAFREGSGSLGPQGPPTYRLPVPNQAPVHSPMPAPIPGQANVPRRESTGKRASQSEKSDPDADPVIKMLATRAANDDGLKNLMRVVASGQASPKQLREFQDHIDELNSVLKSRPSPPPPPPPPPPFGNDDSTGGPPPPHKPGSSSGTYQRSAGPDVFWDQVAAGAPSSAARETLPPIKVEPMSQPFPGAATTPALKVTSSSKADISGVVFDFGGTGDRFSIPRFSILDYLYGGTQVIVSFIVIRRGNTAASGNYKGTMNYYQPVTVRLTTPHPRILEPLARMVASPDEVRSYMNNYFDRLSPAETVYLATRLPRATGAENGETHEISPETDVSLTKPFYPPPNPIMPLTA